MGKNVKKIKKMIGKIKQKLKNKKSKSQEKAERIIRKNEKNLGRRLTEKEKQKIQERVKAKHRRENFIRAGFLALGIPLGAGIHALTTSGDKTEDKDTKTKKKMQVVDEESKNPYKDTLKVNFSSCIENEPIDYVQIINAYNKKYNTKLTAEDISLIKSTPQFLGISEDGTYIQDYKENTPVEGYIDDNIEDIYIMINNKDNKIIASLGKIDGEIKNVDTKVVMTYEGDEFFESYQKIDLTKVTVEKNKKRNQSEKIYDTLENQYEKEREEER